MEGAGLITIEPDPDDKRKILVIPNKKYMSVEGVVPSQKTPKNPQKKDEKVPHPQHPDSFDSIKDKRR